MHKLSIRVFDTILDSSKLKDTVTRDSSSFWKPFCKSSGWDFNYERVHSISDLNFFFSRKIKEDILIFSGHGNEDGFYLSNNDCFRASSEGLIKFPVKNEGKTIIFSSCLIGKKASLCEEYKKYFNADAVFAYRHLMSDRFCFLNESILLTIISHHFISKNSFSLKNFEEFKEKTSFMKNMNQSHVKKHPMVMV